MTIVLATRNLGKISEIKALLPDVSIELATSFPDCPHPEETGTTFKENALIKALAITKFTQKIALADDSGLEVDALGGAPGIYSSRFAGAQANDRENIDYLLQTLNGIPISNRTARFRCAIALTTPDEKTWIVEGVCEGQILKESRGNSGFGYDPLFIPSGYKKTFGELDENIKNLISHRAIALRQIQHIISKLKGNHEKMDKR
tara:strand:+ start:90010 stop:90621 length:612 start_codon:yes stop_codon:yes gene_type:complete